VGCVLFQTADACESSDKIGASVRLQMQSLRICGELHGEIPQQGNMSLSPDKYKPGEKEAVLIWMLIHGLSSGLAFVWCTEEYERIRIDTWLR